MRGGNDGLEARQAGGKSAGFRARKNKWKKQRGKKKRGPEVEDDPPGGEVRSKRKGKNKRKKIKRKALSVGAGEATGAGNDGGAASIIAGSSATSGGSLTLSSGDGDTSGGTVTIDGGDGATALGGSVAIASGLEEDVAALEAEEVSIASTGVDEKSPAKIAGMMSTKAGKVESKGEMRPPEKAPASHFKAHEKCDNEKGDELHLQMVWQGPGLRQEEENIKPDGNSGQTDKEENMFEGAPSQGKVVVEANDVSPNAKAGEKEVDPPNPAPKLVAKNDIILSPADEKMAPSVRKGESGNACSAIELDVDELDTAEEALAALLIKYDACVGQKSESEPGGSTVTPWDVGRHFVAMLSPLRLFDANFVISDDCKQIEEQLRVVIAPANRVRWEVENRDTSDDKVEGNNARLLRMIQIQVWMRMIVWTLEGYAGMDFMWRVIELAEHDAEKQRGKTKQEGKKEKKESKTKSGAQSYASPQQRVVDDLQALMDLVPYVLPHSLDFRQWLRDTLTLGFRVDVPDYGVELLNRFEINIGEIVLLRNRTTAAQSSRCVTASGTEEGVPTKRLMNEHHSRQEALTSLERPPPAAMATKGNAANGQAVAEDIPGPHIPQAKNPDVRWNIMWIQMRNAGWQFNSGEKQYFIRPDAAHYSIGTMVRECTEGVHYFSTSVGAQQYAVRYLGWKGEVNEPSLSQSIQSGAKSNALVKKAEILLEGSSEEKNDIIVGLPKAAKVILCIAVSLSQVWGREAKIPVATLRKYFGQACQHGILDKDDFLSRGHIIHLIEVLVDADLMVSEDEGLRDGQSMDASLIPVVSLRDVEIALKESLLKEGFYCDLVNYVEKKYLKH